MPVILVSASYQTKFFKDALHVGLRQHGIIFQFGFAYPLSRSQYRLLFGALRLETVYRAEFSDVCFKIDLGLERETWDSRNTYVEEECCRQ